MKSTRSMRAFTLVEMLLVIAIISILAAMVISNFSNASQDTRSVIARQQLAVVQEAVNHWAIHEIGRVTTAGGTGKSVTQVVTDYNNGIKSDGSAGTGTAVERFNILKRYLDDGTVASLEVDTTTGRITSQAMRDVGMYLLLPNWTPTSSSISYPKVQLLP